MAMLAEKKKKDRWVLNPRQNDWTRDQNKFGQKLLEKMGWAPGKGLGAKEQGMTEALRVSYKNDIKGLGCVENGDEWTQQQEDYNKLLERLSEGTDDNDVRVSLEERSKNSRARVHYHKFTRGKDLSRYSKDDLKCILGVGREDKKRSSDINDEEIPIKKFKKAFSDEDNLQIDEDTKICDNDDILCDINGEKELSSEEQIDTKCDTRQKKRKKDKNSDYSNDINQNGEIITDIPKKKKKSKRKELDHGLNELQDIEITNALENSLAIDINKKEKKKHKKNKKECIED